MATISLKGFWIGNYAENGQEINITNSKKVSKAVTFEYQSTIKSGKLHADNGLADELKAISEVTVKITPEDENADIDELVGITTEQMTVNGQEFDFKTINTINTGKEKTVAVVRGDMENNKLKYTVLVFPRVIFSAKTNETINTQGENITFSTSAIEGVSYMDANGHFMWKKECSTESEALATINKLFKLTNEETSPAVVQEKVSRQKKEA